MKKHVKLRHFSWLLIFLSCLLGFSQPVAADSHSVTIQLQEVRSGDAGNLSYRLWKVAERDSQEDMTKLRDQLDGKTVAELDKTYTNGSNSNPISSDGSVVVTVPDGIYYVRGMLNGKDETGIVPFMLGVPSDEGTVYPKRKLERGRIKIFKYESQSGKKIPLAGVQFAIYQVGDLQFTKIKNGSFTTDSNGSSVLTTDTNGEILVSGLLPGDYRLRELKPLPGFELIGEDIPFTIAGNDLVVKEVENKRKPPTPSTTPSTEPSTPPTTPPSTPPNKPKLPPFLPHTGTEIMASLVVIGGIVGFIGVLLKKKARKED